MDVTDGSGILFLFFHRHIKDPQDRDHSLDDSPRSSGAAAVLDLQRRSRRSEMGGKRERERVSEVQPGSHAH